MGVYFQEISGHFGVNKIVIYVNSLLIQRNLEDFVEIHTNCDDFVMAKYWNVETLVQHDTLNVPVQIQVCDPILHNIF